MSVPLKQHTVMLYISDGATGEGLAVEDFSATLDELASGRSYTSSPWRAGSYTVLAHLDWSEDRGPDSYEPESEWQHFEVDGCNTIFVNAQLEDRTSPSDLGWIEGTVTYTGSATGFHSLYVRVSTLDYSVVVTDTDVSLFGTDLSGGSFYYGLGSVPPGGLYRAAAFWDVNDNGSRDGDPAAFADDVFFVSPGLPTVGVDIRLPG